MLVGGVLQLADAVAQCFAKLWQLARTNDNQNEDQYDEKMCWFECPHESSEAV